MNIADNIADTMRRLPMVAAVVPLVAGILFFDRWAVPAAVLWAGFPLFCMAAYMLREGWQATCCIAAAIFLFAGAACSLRAAEPVTPYDRPCYMEIEIADIPVVRDGTMQTAARILVCEERGTVMITRDMAMLRSDGLSDVECGDRVECAATLRRFDGGEGTYGRYMMRRGYAGRIYLGAGDVVAVHRGAGRQSLHAAAVERLSRLKLTTGAAAAVAAMGAGERRTMPAELREAYARTGVSHILAVSGLHVGILFLLANLLFRWVTIFRYGNIIRAAAVVASVWLYVAVCGSAPSAVRAAAMFTALQAATLSSSAYSSPNVLAAAAFLMLAADPDTLFNAGFQLSFIAVAAILALAEPLLRRRDGSTGVLRRVWRVVWGTVYVGAVASAATAPLTAYLFGYVAPAGVVVNPAVILCAYIIVGLSMLWIALPVPMLAPVVTVVLQTVADAQNFVAERLSGWSWASFDCELSAGAAAAVYAAMIAATVAVRTLLPRSRGRLFKKLS